MEGIEEKQTPVKAPTIAFSMSREIHEIASALSKAQGVMEPALKGLVNEFYTSRYADLNSFLEVSREPLSENGLAVIQIPHKKDGGVSVTTILTHSSGQWISGGEDFLIPVDKGSAHAYASALTYARRCGYVSLVRLGAEDDDGNQAEKNPPKKAAPAPKKMAPKKMAETSAKEFLIEKCREQKFNRKSFMTNAYDTGLLDPNIFDDFDAIDEDEAKAILSKWDGFLEQLK